jgi:NAD-dependent deacetylase
MVKATSRRDERLGTPDGLTEALRSARAVTVLTGAGVSAESGLPTFRDAMTGLWTRFRPEDLATPEAFRRDPRLVWEWYAWRRRMAREAQPNAAHIAITEMARRVPQFTLITQNVDGLHQRAGSPDVLELHGSLHRARCVREGVTAEEFATEDLPPRCPRCGWMLRPDVVWFGEALPAGALDAAVRAAESCDLFLSVGTSGQVEPAASLVHLAAQAGAVVATINLDVTPHVAARAYQVNGRAGEVLPSLFRAAWPRD